MDLSHVLSWIVGAAATLGGILVKELISKGKKEAQDQHREERLRRLEEEREVTSELRVSVQGMKEILNEVKRTVEGMRTDLNSTLILQSTVQTLSAEVDRLRSEARTLERDFSELRADVAKCQGNARC